MENIWITISFILAITLIVVIFYHIYYRINVSNITKQLEEIISIKDTNQLLTVVAKQKDVIKLVNILNSLIKDIRLSRIQIKRINKSFRESIINISHDLRTPLTTAGGYVQILQTSIIDKEQKEYLDIVLERQNMVRKLLEQLFEYTRIESGEVFYEYSAIDAKKIFVDTLAMYYDDFCNKKEEPIVYLLEKPCIILGDEQGVSRIFSNILFNAIIHGKGEYCFEIKKSDKYVFIFSNSSDHMTQDDLDCIFERFYTKDKSRNKKSSGLGLAIAKEITKQLNGTIEAFYSNGQFSICVSFPKV